MSPRRSALKTIVVAIVIAIIAVLVSVAIPIYSYTLRRSGESMLKNNLSTLRTEIQEYTHDKQKAPETLRDLVNGGYLRDVPTDPITGVANWKVTLVDPTEPGIFGVQSASDKISMEGTRYSDW